MTGTELNHLSNEVMVNDVTNEQVFYENREEVEEDFQKRGIPSSGIIIVNVNLKIATLEKSKPFNQYLSPIIMDKTKKIIVNLRNCRLIDSSFLGAIVYSFKLAKSKGCELVLVWGNANDSTLIALTKIDKVIKIFPDFREAVDYVLQESLNNVGNK